MSGRVVRSFALGRSRTLCFDSVRLESATNTTNANHHTCKRGEPKQDQQQQLHSAKVQTQIDWVARIELLLCVILLSKNFVFFIINLVAELVEYKCTGQSAINGELFGPLTKSCFWNFFPHTNHNGHEYRDNALVTISSNCTLIYCKPLSDY